MFVGIRTHFKNAFFSFALPFGILLSASGCEVYDANLLTTIDARMPTNDVGPDTTVVDQSGCEGQSSAVPKRPDNVDSDSVEQLVFILRDLDLDQQFSWDSTGFNLDGFCTTDDGRTGLEHQSCTPQHLPDQYLHHDGFGGIDNHMGKYLIPLVTQALGSRPEFGNMTVTEMINDATRRGLGNIVVIVNEWNGKADDRRVTVALSQSVYATSAQGVDAETPPKIKINPADSNDIRLEETNEPIPLPAWDGNDWMWLRSDTFINNEFVEEDANLRITSAYVTDNILVAELPAGATLRFSGNNIATEVQLTDTFITGTIDTSQTPARLLNVSIGGRWSIQHMRSTIDKIGICDDATVSLITTRAKEVADVLSNREDPTDLPCDAVSLGVKTDGVAAKAPRALHITAPIKDLCEDK